MANKPLKSIKFPELPDTYTIPQVDLVPTQGSTNAVSSGGVYSALHDTDTTLSQSGQAADAKKTGDEITSLKEDLSDVIIKSTNMLDPTNTESGTINSSGEKVDNTSYHRNIDYISVTPSTKYSTKNLTVVAEYTSDKTFIQRPYVSENTVFTTPSNCYYILAVGSADVSTWRMNKGETLDDSPYGQIEVNAGLDYTDVFKSTSIPYVTDYKFELGFVSLNGGVIGNSTNRTRSVLIDIVEDAFNDYLVFSCNLNSSTYTYTVCALYKNGVFVKNMPTIYSTGQNVVALDGTFNQFRIGFKKANDTDFTAEEIATFAVSVTTNITLSTVKRDVFKSTSIPYVTPYKFESGFVSLNGGVIGDSTKRVRSVLIDIVEDEFNDNLVFACNLSSSTYTYAVCALYKDGVFVKNISSLLYNPSGTVVPLDGTFNQFRIGFKKANDTDFTAEEIATFAVSVTTNIALSTVKGDVDNNSHRIEVLEDNARYETIKYKGKKYCALGDSITYGFAPRNCAEYGTRIDSYAKLAAEKLGMTFENYGIVGSTLAYHANRNPMSVRYTEMPNDADLITVMGGTNDIRNGIRLGTFADRTNETYYGALHVVLGGLYKKYFIDQGVTVGKTKKIIVCTPIKLLESSASSLGGTGTLVDFDAWIDAVKEVSAYYSFPVLDFYNLSGINPHLNETVQGTETGYTGVYNPYITDGTHPTKEGQQMMADVLCGFLNALL